MSNKPESFNIEIIDSDLDAAAAVSPPESALIQRLIDEASLYNEPGWPENVRQDFIEHQQVSIDAIRDVLTLAEERIGDKESYTREELLKAMSWAAYAGVLSSQDRTIMSEGMRRRSVGNGADGRPSWGAAYPPVPLFDKEQGEDDE